ncbi:MAG: hypothetical protein P4L66_14930 [Acetobacteraceae bacterium]|nr:hypothetical protein [Acetobacteraceae bacterium]
MADLSDVETAIAALVEAILYPQGTGAPSILGTLTRVYRGWPNPAALNTDLAAGNVNITIFPDAQSRRNTTRFIDPPTPATPIAPTLTVAVTGQSVTFGGTASLGQLAGLLIDNAAFVHRTQTGDSPEGVAATLAAYIRTTRIAHVTGASIAIPGAGSVIGRVVADQSAQTETRRQLQTIRLSCWCPNPTTRDSAASAIDQALSLVHYLTLPDGTAARLQEAGTLVFDQSQNANLYRRDLLLDVEYATTASQTLPALIFGLSQWLPNGNATQTLLG